MNARFYFRHPVVAVLVAVVVLAGVEVLHAEQDGELTVFDCMVRALEENKDFELDHASWLLSLERLDLDDELWMQVGGGSTLKRPGATGGFQSSVSGLLELEVDEYEVEVPVSYDIHDSRGSIGVDIERSLRETIDLKLGFSHAQDVEIRTNVYDDITRLYLGGEKRILPRPVSDEELIEERELLQINREFRGSQHSLLFAVYDSYLNVLQKLVDVERLEFAIEEQEIELERIARDVADGKLPLRQEITAEEDLHELGLDLEDARYDLELAKSNLKERTGDGLPLESGDLSWGPDLVFRDPELWETGLAEALEIAHASRADYLIQAIDERLRAKDLERAQAAQDWSLNASADLETRNIDDWRPTLTFAVWAGRALVDPGAETDLTDRRLSLERARRALELKERELQRAVDGALRGLAGAQRGLERARTHYQRSLESVEEAERDLELGLIKSRDLEREEHKLAMSARELALAEFRLQGSKLNLIEVIGRDLVEEIEGLQVPNRTGGRN